MAEHTIGELLKPQEGAGVRFTTKQSLSMDLHQHGINGFYRDGRFWSCDMSDHWTPREVTNWTHTAVGAASSPSIEREVSGEASADGVQGTPALAGLADYLRLMAHSQSAPETLRRWADEVDRITRGVTPTPGEQR